MPAGPFLPALVKLPKYSLLSGTVFIYLRTLLHAFPDFAPIFIVALAPACLGLARDNCWGRCNQTTHS